MTDTASTATEPQTADPFAGVEDPANDLEHDLDRDPPANGDGDGGELFDPNSYADPALRLESREGRHVDEIRIPFSGTIVLNRKDKSDVAFFKSLHQGRRYDLEIEATVVADAEKSSYDKDGDEKTLAAVKSLRVTGLTVPADEAVEAA